MHANISPTTIRCTSVGLNGGIAINWQHLHNMLIKYELFQREQEKAVEDTKKVAEQAKSV
jgi:hypothetical protein